MEYLSKLQILDVEHRSDSGICIDLGDRIPNAHNHENKKKGSDPGNVLFCSFSMARAETFRDKIYFIFLVILSRKYSELNDRQLNFRHYV